MPLREQCSEWRGVSLHGWFYPVVIELSTLLVVAMNLSRIPVFEVRHKHLQEVEDFDRSLVGEWSQCNVLIAVIGAHNFLSK